MTQILWLQLISNMPISTAKCKLTGFVHTLAKNQYSQHEKKHALVRSVYNFSDYNLNLDRIEGGLTGWTERCGIGTGEQGEQVQGRQGGH